MCIRDRYYSKRKVHISLYTTYHLHFFSSYNINILLLSISYVILLITSANYLNPLSPAVSYTHLPRTASPAAILPPVPPLFLINEVPNVLPPVSGNPCTLEIMSANTSPITTTFFALSTIPTSFLSSSHHDRMSVAVGSVYHFAVFLSLIHISPQLPRHKEYLRFPWPA